MNSILNVKYPKDTPRTFNEFQCEITFYKYKINTKYYQVISFVHLK